MSVLSRYILALFLKNTIIIILGLCAVFMVFDVLSNASQITQNSSSAFKTIFHYLGLKFSIILVLVMPIGTLLGALLTMHKMVGNREMVAIGTAGITIYKVAMVMVCGAIFLVSVQLVASEYFVTDHSLRLRLWAENDYKNMSAPSPTSERALWASSNNYIFHYKSASPDGHILSEPVLIRRNNDGEIDEYIRAKLAIFEKDVWRFEQIYQEGLKTNLNTINNSITLPLQLRPSDFSIPAQTYEEMHLGKLWSLAYTNNGLGKPSSLYALWFQRKIAQALGIVAMVLLIAPIGLFKARRYNTMAVSFSFVLVGFSYFVFERLMFSYGESGELPIFLAVWTPLLIFSFMSLWFMINKQE